MKLRILVKDKYNLFFVIISGITLLISLFGWLRAYIPFNLSWVAIILCGIPIIIGAVKGLLFHHDIKADVLVSIALIASIFIREYFAAGEVAFIMAVGTLLEESTSKKSQHNIEKLMKMAPHTARIVRNGIETIMPSEQVVVGDNIIVLAGETIAVDGIITMGQTSIDQSIMTGESMLVDKAIGDSVISGTVNQFGTFTMKATSLGNDSSLQRMIKLAKQADLNKAPIIRLTDKWATWTVVIVLALAILTWLVTGEIIRAVTILVVFCPCSFILATPTAIMAGIGNATKFGILIRSGDALQRIANVKNIAFDKTGTLTYGKPEVVAYECFLPDISSEKMLSFAASVEKSSEHPIGKAIFTYYKNHGGIPEESENFILLAGQGVQAKIYGRNILVGKIGLFEAKGLKIPKDIEVISNTYIEKGATAVFVEIDELIAGFIILSDKVRADAKKTVTQLHQLGIESLLLTGDNSFAAINIANKVGITIVKSDLLPEEKMNVLKEYQRNNSPICMVGDGVNDMLALKSAYAGIAMGGVGSDITVEAADAVLISDDIQRIPYLISISKKVMRKITENIIFSMSLNLIAVILSVYGILNPVVGAIVHNAGSVTVVLNSALLLTVKDKDKIRDKGISLLSSGS